MPFAHSSVRTAFPNDDSKKDAKIVDAGFKKWSATLDMTEADWADAVAYVADRYGSSIKVTNKKAPYARWSPIDQYIGIIDSTMGDSAMAVDPTYITDALDATLTTLGRVGYVSKCINSDDQAFWAMCQADIDALDRKAIAADVRRDTTHGGYDRMKVRIDLLDIWKNLNEHNAKMKQLKSSDPGYAKMFEIAASARKDFAAKADPKLLELVGLMDEARITNSRKASDGCAAKTWPAVQAAVGAMPAKSFSGVIHDLLKQKQSALDQALALVVATPNGYLASLSHYLCSKFDEKQDYLARELGSVMAYWPGYRGPRSAAQTAIVTAGIQLDDRDAKIGYPDMTRPIASVGSSGGGGWGEISNVKVKGDTAVVTFAKVKSKQQNCVKGHETNRVRQIDSAGNLIYEYICEKWQTETISEPPFREQTVKAKYTTGLKKGSFVYIIEDVVTFAYSKAGAATPIAVGGVAVK